jgi:hypothetical protein
MRIEAENNELVVRNDKGDVAIIPRTHRQEALKHLKNGNHKALDELISNLPYMEDYADEGTIIPEDPPKGKSKTVTKNVTSETVIPKNALMNQQQYESFKNDYYSNAKWLKYSANKPGQACVGSSCKNAKTFLPEQPSFYEDYERAFKEHPEYGNKAVSSSQGAEHPAGESPGIDAWDAGDFITYNKLGEYIVNPDDPTYFDKLKNTDIRNIPINSMLLYGDARGKYLAKDAKSWRGESGTTLPKHGGVTLGYVEDVDEKGNKVYNLLIDELGPKTIGPGKNASSSWENYITSHDMRSIIKRYSAKDIDYWKATGQEKPEFESKMVRPQLTDVVERIKQIKKDLLNSIKVQEEDGTLPKGSYEKAKKEGIKTGDQEKLDLAKSLGLMQGDIVTVPKQKK